MKNHPLWLYAITILLLNFNGPLPARCEVPQRRIVVVGGLRTEILTIGIEDREPGEPLIIFQNALGSTMETWNAVIEEVASFAAVLAYNRPGIGASDGIGSPPSAARISEHLQVEHSDRDMKPCHLR